MSERAPVPNYEKRPELDPARKIELPPTDDYIQIVNVFRSRFDGKLVPRLQEALSRTPVSEILTIAKAHALRLRARNESLDEYVGTFVQHEDHQALRREAI